MPYVSFSFDLSHFSLHILKFLKSVISLIVTEMLSTVLNVPGMHICCFFFFSCSNYSSDTSFATVP